MYCPLTKDECKTNACVLYDNDDCLVRIWLKGKTTVLAQAYGRSNPAPKPDPAACKWLTEITIKDLAKELVAYVKECTPDDQDPYYTWGMDSSFLKSKGVFNTPASMQDKLDRAIRLAERILYAERSAKEHARTIRERQALPGLMEKCLLWAQTLGLRNLTAGEVDEFLNQRGVELERLNRQSLRVQANIRLKQSKDKGR